MMVIEVLKCKDCGTIFAVEVKTLWHNKSCIHCESKNIDIYNFDVKNIEEEKENK